MQGNSWPRPNDLAEQWSEDQAFMGRLMSWVEAGLPCLLQETLHAPWNTQALQEKTHKGEGERENTQKATKQNHI